MSSFMVEVSLAPNVDLVMFSRYMAFVISLFVFGMMKNSHNNFISKLMKEFFELNKIQTLIVLVM